MKDEEKRRRDKCRASCLLEKIRAKAGWSMEALLAYCQGRAYEVGEDATTKVTGGLPLLDVKKRKQVLKAGLLAMVEELLKCAAVLED